MDFDESKISGDDGEIYLMQWLEKTETDLIKSDADSLKSSQANILNILVKVVLRADPYPNPGRPLRAVVARCLIILYQKGETRTLFDTMSSFLKIVGDLKATNKDQSKVAAFYCIGEIMATFGAQNMSFMAEIAIVSLKNFKLSSNSILLRYHSLVSLKKALSTAARALNDNVMKDIFRQMRSALSDKSLPIQRAACEVLMVLYPPGDGNRTVAEIETIVNLCIKGLDSADQVTRRALSKLAGHLLASSQTIKISPSVEPAKKNKKDTNDDDDEVVTSAPAASDALKTIMTIPEMLNQLSTAFNKLNASRKQRIGIFDLYIALFTTLGSSFVETNYSVIVKHLFVDLVHGSRHQSSKYEVLLTRKLVGILLRDLIGVRLLSEQGQIGAIRELSNTYLKKWPALLPRQVATDPEVLVMALKEVAGLIRQLGNAPPAAQEALSEPLVTLLTHPSHSVRVAAAWALRCFSYSTPLLLPKTIFQLMDLLQKDISYVITPSAPSDIYHRTIGHAYGLGAIFAVISDRPLYVSYDIGAKVLDMAIQLLKRAGEHDLDIAGIEVEVAWTLIASLMSLGPNFVRSHLPQLLVLWRNAIPKPTSKDTSIGSGRSIAEWTFLLHVRECALGAILCFLRHNSPTLVTLDVARRMASLLSNGLSFANAMMSQKIEEAPDQSLQNGQKSTTLLSREARLRRRAFQCFSALGSAGLGDLVQVTLLQSTIAAFAGVDPYGVSAMTAAINASSGNFTTIWQAADNYGYGVTTIDTTSYQTIESTGKVDKEKNDRLNRDTLEVIIDAMINTPVIGSCEYDPIVLCQAMTTGSLDWPEPPSPTSAVADTAVELFAMLLPQQDMSACSRLVSELVESVRSPKLEKNLGRKAAVLVNAVIALDLVFKYANSTQSRHSREIFENAQLSSTLASFLKDVIVDGDGTLRKAGSDALGRLAGLCGTSFLAEQIKTLVDLVVNNRDPNARAGCALTFGAIYTHVGSLVAGPLLKTTVNILMSLGNDPHPVVHHWSLTALSQVIGSASLAYAPFVSSTLGMLFKLFLSDSHEPEGGSLNNSNIKGDLPVYQVLCRIIDALINVLGPDIQDSVRTRTLLLDLVHEFLLDSDEGICVEAIKCIQHFLIFAPEFVDISDLVRQLKTHLSSSKRPLRLASINAVYQLVQKDAFMMSKIGGDRLVEDLFGMLDSDPSIEGVRDVIMSWLRQTVVHNPSAWIDLCQRNMSRAIGVSTAQSKIAGPLDDEGESLSVGISQDSSSSHAQATSRWRTQLFALQCLHDICTLVAQSGRREHLDIPYATKQGLQVPMLLASRLPDLIKMAFVASAAYVTEIRLQGLVVLRDVIEVFATSPDPDYEEFLLLEQHQAPITAALTPAFSADSTPEILASAVQVCGIFVGCGIVRDVSRMGRILKLLTSGLEQSKESGTLSLGDAGELSPNASVMLRISTLSAWAALQVARVHQTYLVDVVRPYEATLATLWISSLRDYASIRADSEMLLDSGSTVSDSPYSGLGREVLLPYYYESWPIIIQAVSTAMQLGDIHVIAAMDGRTISSPDNPSPENNSNREEPTMMFYPIFGLIFEALTTSSNDAVSSSRQNTIICLEMLINLVKPEYSGKALLEPTVFDEFISLCYRMALTESAVVQLRLVRVISSFACSQGRDRLVPIEDNVYTNDGLPPKSPITHCLRVCASVLKQIITSHETLRNYAEDSQKDRTDLIRAAFSAFSQVSDILGPSIKEESRAVIASLYADLLKDEKSSVDLAGPTLQSLKEMLENAPQPKMQESLTRYSQLLHGLLSATLINVDDMRGREGAISTMKVKNNLLAAVLILTVAPSTIQLSRAAVDRCCYLICEKLKEPKNISLTAAHCAKTLIIAGTSGNPMLKYCTKALIPGMIKFVASVAALVDDESKQNEHLDTVEEVLKAFSSFFNGTDEIYRPRLLGVFLPCLTILLNPMKTPGTAIHIIAVEHILSFATTAPSAFKEVTDKMNANVKETLELSIRQALGSRVSSNARPTAKPQISLRSF